MRLCHYSVINKETGKRVFTRCSERECREFMTTLEDKENYYIGYKWLSI